MSQHVAEDDGRPRGKRIGGAEVERRLAAVEAMLAEGRPRAEIAADCRRRFSMSVRTVDDYIARVRERWVAESAEASPTLREKAIARLQALARKLEAKGAWAPLVNAERLLADIQGLRAPAKVDVRADLSARSTSIGAVTTREEACRIIDSTLADVLDQIAEGNYPTGESLAAAVRRTAAALEARERTTPDAPGGGLGGVSAPPPACQ